MCDKIENSGVLFCSPIVSTGGGGNDMVVERGGKLLGLAGIRMSGR